jgi:biopolymer transport protein ExbD
MGLGRLHVPTRWVWLAALSLSIGLPAAALLRSAEEPASMPAITAAEMGTPATVHAAGEAGRGGVAAKIRAALTLLERGRGQVDQALAVAASLIRPGPALERWVAVAWGSASLLFAWLLIGSMLRLGRRSRAWPREVIAGHEVRVSPNLGPATLGLLEPEIVIPRWAKEIGEPELAMVLAHEHEHVRSKDPLVLALGLAPAVACPWNPLILWQVRRLKEAVEVDCDHRVLRRGTSARRYGDLLMRMGCEARTDLMPVPTMTGSTSLLERRLIAMKKTTLRKALPRAVGATIAGLGLAVVACTTEAPAEMEDPQASEGQERFVGIWVEPDGAVYIDDALHRVEDVYEVVGPLRAAAGETLVAAIGGEEAVPYGVMSRLQQELQAAGVVRVVFNVTQTALRAPGLDASSLGEEALGLVLPEAGQPVPVSGRNLLHLLVQPSGVVHMRRGQSTQVQQMPAAEVEGLWRQEVASNPNLIAAVKIHPEAPHTYMVAVLDALQRADAQRISIQEMAN